MTASTAIATAIDVITTADPVVGRYLTAHIRAGFTCTYQPDAEHPAQWLL